MAEAESPQQEQEQKQSQQQWSAFRAERDRSLPAPHGWLSLTSFQWLPADFASLELVAGLWRQHEGRAEVRFRAEERLLPLGRDTAEPGREGSTTQTRTATASLAEDESLEWFRYGTIVIELVLRGGRYGIRTRDSAAALLRDFTQVPVFPYQQEWALTGQYRAYPEPVLREIGTAHELVPAQAEFCGELTLWLPEESGRPGAEVALLAQPGSDGGLLINFGDASNGAETAGWRYLRTAAPEADGSAAIVTVDFNYALNWPSGFTPFGTCPRPVPENILDAPVRAGERLMR